MATALAREGDWKTAALVRAMKVMAAGLKGGRRFMEDYTYHFEPERHEGARRAHAGDLPELSPPSKPKLEIHPLSIGGKADPVRLVFDAKTGPALNASIMDMGNRFRMIVNEVDVVPTDAPLPKLPVARALWLPRPNLKVAAAAWIYAGGAHHTGFSFDLTLEHLRRLRRDGGHRVPADRQRHHVSGFKKELRWNDMYYALAKGL